QSQPGSARFQIPSRQYMIGFRPELRLGAGTQVAFVTIRCHNQWQVRMSALSYQNQTHSRSPGVVGHSQRLTAFIGMFFWRSDIIAPSRCLVFFTPETSALLLTPTTNNDYVELSGH